MVNRFLLIRGEKDNHWKGILEEALLPLGTLEVVQAEDAITYVDNANFTVVILDATVIEEVESLVSNLRAKHPEFRIVVATASPTWQRARAAFEAGAMDYIPRSFSKLELHNTFIKILQKPLPPWPR